MLRSQLRKAEEREKQRIDEHTKDKEAFREQNKMMKEMFDTLKDDHEGTKKLLQEAMKTMGKISDRSQPVSVLPSANNPSTSQPIHHSNSVDAEIIPSSDSTANQDTTIHETLKSKPATTRKMPSTSTVKNRAAKQRKRIDPSFWEKHTPSFRKTSKRVAKSLVRLGSTFKN